MADNVGYTPGVGATVAADDIGGVLHQRVKIGVGADGVATDVSAANPMPVTGTVEVTAGTPLDVTGTVAVSGSVAVTGGLTDAELRASPVSVVALDPSTATSFGPITTANVVLFSAIDTTGERSIVLQLTGLWDGTINLQASQDGTDWFDAFGVCQTNEIAPTNSFYAPGVIVVPATARYFRAVTSVDFSGTVSGLYSQRAFDVAPFFVRNTLTDVSSDVRMPVAGVDPLGNLRQIAVSEFGQVMPADGRVITGSLARIGTIWMVETTGYNSISVQIFAQTAFVATMTFQASNDATTWAAVNGFNSTGPQSGTTTTAAAGLFIFPAIARYFRVQITAYSSGIPAAVGVLKSAPAFFPVSTPSVNLGQLNTNSIVTAATGVIAVGGNIAVGAAPTASPTPIGGWDGTNTRRILTDAVSGGIALGANGASNGSTMTTLVSAATNNLTQLKATLGKIHLIDIQNTNAAIRYLKIFNLPSASVTMGTTSAVGNFSIPGSGKLQIETPLGLNYGGTGISYAMVTGSSLTDNTAVGAGDLIANFQFV
jgi:hypothetical protein